MTLKQRRICLTGLWASMADVLRITDFRKFEYSAPHQVQW